MIKIAVYNYNNNKGKFCKKFHKSLIMDAITLLLKFMLLKFKIF